MKLWHRYFTNATNRILLIIITMCVLMLIAGSLGLLFPNLYPGILKAFDNPRYAPGEASAMVESVYHWRSNSADLYRPLNEEYLGQGIWEVKSSCTYDGERAIFRVYETSGTAAIYNAVAASILDRREELEARAKPPRRVPTIPTGQFDTLDLFRRITGREPPEE